MSKYNFFKNKFMALESFYLWIEQGSPYDIAADQTMYYDPPENEFDEFVVTITIATRFVRSEKPMAQRFKGTLKDMIPKFHTMDLNQYGLTDDELKVLKGEIHEVELYISKS